MWRDIFYALPTEAEVIPLRLLVVQDNADLGQIWCNFLRRRGVDVTLVTNGEDAVRAIAMDPFDALIIEPVLSGGLPVADFATFRNPEIIIIAVTKSDFFSGGALFDLIPNVRGVLRPPVRPEDLAAYLEHFVDRVATKEKTARLG